MFASLRRDGQMLNTHWVYHQIYSRATGKLMKKILLRGNQTGSVAVGVIAGDHKWSLRQRLAARLVITGSRLGSARPGQ
jgi:hypothetical protein